MQLARLKKRMSITATEARKMIESQVSLKEKMRRADHLVWNNGARAVADRAGAIFGGIVARTNMDERRTHSQTETVEAGVPPAHEDAADTAATTALRTLDLNELEEFPDKKLKTLARDLDVHLHPARSRHRHILDIVRAAISLGTTVTAKVFSIR